MAILADALAGQGTPVVYVASERMSAERGQQGWAAPSLKTAQLTIAHDETAVQALVQSAPANSIHLCQGLRGNGLVAVAQQHLRVRGLRLWVIMETVDDAGRFGILKRLIYRWLFWRWRNALEGVLTIGADTPDWVVARGMPHSKVFPFAYFLCEPDRQELQSIWDVLADTRPYRFIFVGNLIERKRVDRLISAIASLNRPDVDLLVVGCGPEEVSLKAQASELLPGQVQWLGRKTMSEIPEVMAQADCLVLPSRHDGWGAVVSEALMVGTPAICSDACGSSVVVSSSGRGAVFPAGDDVALTDALRKQVDAGRVSIQSRQELAQWATCLGALTGADYLKRILVSEMDGAIRPTPPWNT
ncbi:glycosyltransferase [Chlorobium phaeovibrioides]|uniref:glycosyltransferase n=1 Tax=Chlorobium phaeovibrioides TaxID=1094 RepID=UPI00174D53D2|nr:glycosyltransferase [Chlorobium phaeovibrioides]